MPIDNRYREQVQLLVPECGAEVELLDSAKIKTFILGGWCDSKR